MKLLLASLVALVILFLIGGAHMGSPTPFTTRRKRRQPDPSNSPGAPDMTATLAVATLHLRVTVPVPVSQSGIPHVGATGGAHTGTEYPTAITYVSPGVFDLTYAHSIATGDVITYPSRDPAIRSNNGAYVAAITKTL